MKGLRVYIHVCIQDLRNVKGKEGGDRGRSKSSSQDANRQQVSSLNNASRCKASSQRVIFTPQDFDALAGTKHLGS